MKSDAVSLRTRGLREQEFVRVNLTPIYVAIPVYNGSRTIKNVIRRIPSFGSFAGTILVDDGSMDDSLQIVSSSDCKNLTVITHKKNRGYGGAQKTLMKKALQLGAEYIILLHQDGQYPPEIMPLLARIALRYPSLDIILAPRTNMIQGRMPLIKYVGNRTLTSLQNSILGVTFSEYHTGMRVYSKKAMQALNFEKYADDYFFDTQIMAEAVAKGLSFGEVPIPTYYGPEVTQNTRILTYGVHCILETLLYRAKYRYVSSKSTLTKFSPETVPKT